MPVDTLNPDESQDLLGHFIGQVERSFWSTPYAEAANDNKPNWDGADKVREYWHVRVLDVLQPDYDGNVPETMVLSWTVGNGWWGSENGERVRHNDDASDEEIENGSAKPHTFKVNTSLGRFLHLIQGGIKGWETEMGPALVLDGSDRVEYDIYPGLRDYLYQNDLVDSREASIWNGMVFEFRGLGLKYRGFEGEPRMRPMPVRFIGVEGISDLVNPRGDAEPNPATDHEMWLEMGATDPTAAILVKLATDASSHTEFQRNALLVPDVKASDELSQGVMDEGNWR